VTDEAVQQAVADEMSLANSVLAAAEALVGLGLAPDAASRAYYAAFHAAWALLFSTGVEPGTHHGVQVLLARHFVRPGRLSADHYKHLLELEGLREAADYQSAFALGVEHIRPEVEKAKALLEAARAPLRTGGFLP